MSAGMGMELPCLAFHHCGSATTLFSASEKKPITAGGDMDELLVDKVVCPTARGHLLVRDSSTSEATFLLNPRNGEKVCLPTLHDMEDSVLMDCHCLLSDEPTSSSCIVLLVEPADTFIWYCHPDDDQWVEYDYDIGSLPMDLEGTLFEKRLICPMAAYRGRFYFNSRSTDMGVLEFCPEPVFSSIEIHDDTAPIDTAYAHGHYHEIGSIRLVESDGELYKVSMYAKSTRLEMYRAVVHRMDFAERRWRRVEDLGGRVFLCSLFYFGASCSGGGESSGLQEDCIYVVYPVKKAVQVFNVKEGTVEMHKLDEAPSSDKAFWVIPTTST